MAGEGTRSHSVSVSPPQKRAGGAYAFAFDKGHAANASGGFDYRAYLDSPAKSEPARPEPEKIEKIEEENEEDLGIRIDDDDDDIKIADDDSDADDGAEDEFWGVDSKIFDD